MPFQPYYEIVVHLMKSAQTPEECSVSMRPIFGAYLIQMQYCCLNVFELHKRVIQFDVELTVYFTHAWNTMPFYSRFILRFFRCSLYKPTLLSRCSLYKSIFDRRWIWSTIVEKIDFHGFRIHRQAQWNCSQTKHYTANKHRRGGKQQ